MSDQTPHGEDFLDQLPAARHEAMECVVEELHEWRPWPEYREMYLLSEYNDGITDPEPPEVRLLDVALALPYARDAVGVAMPGELAEIAEEHRVGQLAEGTVTLRRA